MKSLAAAIICIVAASCGSRDKPADPLVGLEASEKMAVLHLNQEERERYLRDRPLAVIREYLSSGQMRPDEIASDLVAVQRARRSNTESGWRMIMVGGRSLLVFLDSEGKRNALALMVGFSERLRKHEIPTTEQRGALPDWSVEM